MSYIITESCTGCTVCTRKCPVHAISGEHKQQHHINPNLCIECGVCGKVCAFQSILNEAGQFTQRVKPSQWLKPVWDYQACVECRICVLTCPTGSINLARYNGKQDGLKPSQPFLQNAVSCIGCGFCQEDCPTAAIIMKEPLPVAELQVA